MIPGIDLSSNNGQTDNVTLVKALVAQDPEAFAAVKVSQGDWYVNEDLDEQRDGLHAAGLKTLILYHWFEAVASGGPNLGKPLSGAANADFFLETIGRHGGLKLGEAAAIDWETEYGIGPNADLGAAQADLLGRLTRPLGVAVIEYSRDNYVQNHNLSIPSNRYWKAAPGLPSAPACLIWQFSWHGREPGIFTEVDLDYLLIPIADFRRRFAWGFQPDPLAGQKIDGQPDVDGDVETMIKAAKANLVKTPPDVPTAIADLDRAVTKFGLIGA